MDWEKVRTGARGKKTVGLALISGQRGRLQSGPGFPTAASEGNWRHISTGFPLFPLEKSTVTPWKALTALWQPARAVTPLLLSRQNAMCADPPGSGGRSWPDVFLKPTCALLSTPRLKVDNGAGFAEICCLRQSIAFTVR